MQGIDGAGDVDDLGIVEAADDVRDGIGRANVAEKLITEAFALRCALNESRDVDELHGGGYEALGLDELSDLREPLIGYGDDTGIGVDGAEGIVGGLGFGRGEGVEDGALADIGQADDSAIQWHYDFPLFH